MDLRRSDRLGAGQLYADNSKREPHPFWISTDFQLYADNQPVFLSAPPCPSPGRPRCNRSPPAAPDGAATTASPPAPHPPPRYFGEIPRPQPMHRINPRIETRHRATSLNYEVDRLRRQRPVRDRAPPVDRPEHRPLRPSPCLATQLGRTKTAAADEEGRAFLVGPPVEVLGNGSSAPTSPQFCRRGFDASARTALREAARHATPPLRCTAVRPTETRQSGSRRRACRPDGPTRRSRATGAARRA